MGLQRFPLSDFRGGLNTVDAPFQLETNEALSLMNISLTRRGVISQRKGKTLFSTLVAQAENIRPWYRPNEKLLMASINGSIYKIDTAGVATELFDGTDGTIWSFEQSTDSAGVDHLWCMNGVDAPKKYDGTTLSNWANSPPNGTMLRIWRNRMCVAGVDGFPARLFFSGDFTTVPPTLHPETPAASYGTNWVDIKTTDDDLDNITWLEVLGDNLIVFKRRVVWSVYDSARFSNRVIGSPGCEGRFQSAVSAGRVYYFARSGVWATNGIQPPNMESEKIESFISDGLVHSQINRVRLCASRDERVFVALPMEGSVQNNRLLELIIGESTEQEGVTDENVNSWLLHDLPIASLCVYRPNDTDELFGASSNAPKIHRLFDGDTDEGSYIDAHWQSGWRPIQSEEPFERLRRLNVHLSGMCKAEVYCDFALEPSFSAVLDARDETIGIWDDGGPWEEPGGVWGVWVEAALKRARPETRGRYHSIRFSSQEFNPADVPDDVEGTGGWRPPKDLSYSYSGGFSIYAVEIALRGGKEH